MADGNKKDNFKADVSCRYKSKLKVIKMIDPYKLNFESPFYIKEFKELPDIELDDIMYYFVCTHSLYTGESFKAFKSLQAVRYVDAGYVSVNGYKINNNFVLLGKVSKTSLHFLILHIIIYVMNTYNKYNDVFLFQVNHFFKQNAPPLQSWLIIKPDGAILSAHCTCMAGLGEACSHAAAIVFAVYYEQLKQRQTNQRSCTESLSIWNVPRALNKVTPKKAKFIQLGKKKFRKSDNGKIK